MGRRELAESFPAGNIVLDHWSMLKVRVLILGFVALSALPSLAEPPTKITLSDFSCELPFGWHQISRPKAAFAAVPAINDGRFFGVVVEPSQGCPVPCEIGDESGYEKGYWGSYDKTFESHSHAQITGREFRVINGVPFRILHAVRENNPGTSAKVYLDAASTPGNGNSYGILTMRRGLLPDDDREIHAMLESFTFVTPPRLAWYQPLLHYFGEIVGAPLLLVALGLGIYFLTIRGKPDVSTRRKTNVGMWGIVLAMLNGIFIAGTSSVTGVASMILLGILIWLVQPLEKERRALIAQGTIEGPKPGQLKRRFWILIASCFLGLAVADAQFIVTGLSFPFIALVDVFTAGMIGLIFWFQRRKFFPKGDSVDEPKA